MTSTSLFYGLSALVATGILNHADAAIVFSDSDFSPTVWTAAKDADTSPGSAATFTVGQVATGGNPGAYQVIDLSWSGPGGIRVTAQTDAFTYDPSTSGAIIDLSFTFDLALFNGGSAGGVGYSAWIEQGGVNYYPTTSTLTPLSPTLNVWEERSLSGLSESDFVNLLGDNPDFSDSGAPLLFGYYASAGRSFAGATATSSGIDNFSVTVNNVPEPSSILLAGVCSFFLLFRRQRGN